MVIPLRPDDIVTKRFATELRGESRAEVRAFLKDVAAEQAALIRRASKFEALLAEQTGRLREAEDLLHSADGTYAEAQTFVAKLEAERDAAVTKATEAARLASDLADHFGNQVTEVLKSAAIAANTIRSEAETTAVEHRRTAEEQADLLLQTARDQAQLAAQQAERVVREAKDWATTTVREADQAAQGVRAQAEQAGRELRSTAEAGAVAILKEAEEQAERRMAAVQEEASELLAGTNEEVDRLRKTEKELRAWLESTTSWIRNLRDSALAEALEPNLKVEPDEVDQRPPALPVGDEPAAATSEAADPAEPSTPPVP